MWEALYKAHYPELLSYCAAACHDPALAEDLTQEVFLKALQNVDTFEGLGPSQCRAWLFRTLKNLLVDRYRRAALEADCAGQAPEEEAIASEPGFERLENTLLLQKLPEQDRILFRLRYLEGYSAAELAEMFDLPAGTIRSKLSRSRKILQSLILEE